MRIGLIDVDGHNFPNLALMKLSAWHKAQGDEVEWWFGWHQYDRVYMSKVFDSSYTEDVFEPVNAKEIIKGGTGYGLDNKLPPEIEHIYPDYSLYPKLTQDTAYGFLSRGCPNNCGFCIVSKKEGRCSVKVANLNEFHNGQKNIVLMDPNILACADHMDLLGQLAKSKASVDINQGLDATLLTEENIQAINRIKLKAVHFAWDLMAKEDAVLSGLELYKSLAKHKPHGKYGMVYVLVNYNTNQGNDLHRIYTIREMGFDPYVMVYDKPNAPKEVMRLQRWCNNIPIFRRCKKFEDYR